MFTKEEIVKRLGIEDWSSEKQDEAVDIAFVRIGAAATDDLSEQDYNEYEAIINNDQAVISAWLDANEPEYKNSPVYQAFEEGYEEDPEKNDPAKLFASFAWIQQHVPNKDALIDEALEKYKQELAA